MDYNVNEVDGGEGCPKALNLWQRLLDNSDDFNDKCSWYYEYEKNKSKIFLLQSKNEKHIIGAIGFVIREFDGKFGNKSLGFCSDFAIDEKHRILRPALLLLKSLITSGERSADILFGFPNNQAVAVMKRAGFDVLDKVSRYALILKPSYYLMRTRYSHILRPVYPIINTIIKTYYRTKKMILYSKYVIYEVKEADDSFNKLWNNWIDQCKLFAGKRDFEYIKWRFSNMDSRLFVLNDVADQQLVGYAVIHINEAGHWIIYDFFALPVGNALESLLMHIANIALEEGGVSLSLVFLGSSKIKQKILNLNFIERPSERKAVIKVSVNDVEEDLFLRNPENWYVTSADELG